MNRLLIAPPLRIKIYPKHRIPRHSLKRHPIDPIPAFLFHKAVPFPSLRPRDPREIRPAPGAIRRQIHHERAHPARGFAGGRPVEVVHVVAPGAVPLGPEPLDEGVARPALDAQRALLDALDDGVALEKGFGGVADAGVVDFLAGVEDGGELPVGGAEVDEVLRFRGGDEVFDVDDEGSGREDVDIVGVMGTLKVEVGVDERLDLGLGDCWCL